MKTALSIAGTDPSGGAGIQADLKTMTMNGVFAMSAVTALVAQNTTGVRAIVETEPAFLAQQLDAVYEDIPPDAVKVGMVFSSRLAAVIAQRLRQYGAQRVVVDPVMVAACGDRLIDEPAVESLRQALFPLATVVTPNIPEAEVLTGMTIRSSAEMEAAAQQLSQDCGCAVLLKGGHSVNDASDLLYADGVFHRFQGRRIRTANTHGTGCTLSSAIAANLAKGFPLTEAICRAKAYLTEALAAMLDLGRGSGPLDHAFARHGVYAEEAAE